MLKGFKEFLLRGNVLDLAVGIIIGAAFTAVVTGLMDGVLNPLIALIFGQPDISNVGFCLGTCPAGADATTASSDGTFFGLGLFLQAVLNFVIVAATLYFVVVVPVNHLTKRIKRGEVPPPEPEVLSPDVALLTEIRDLLAKRDTAP
jgi:large conductance mechanosensitive channel